MANVIERSRGGSAESKSIDYRITGASSESAARSAMLAESPSTYSGLPRQTDAASVTYVDDSFNIWDGTVSYAENSGTADTGSSSYSFDISGSNIKLKTAYATTKYNATDKVLPDFGGAINVQKSPNGLQVDGVDIFVPAMEWTYTTVKSSAAVNATYLESIYAAIGKVNATNWTAGITFAAGSALLVGVSGQLRPSGDKWDITFRALIEPNVTGLSIEGVSIDKKGWQYAWPLYEEAPDDVAKAIGQELIGVYVQDVYRTATFPN